MNRCDVQWMAIGYGYNKDALSRYQTQSGIRGWFSSGPAELFAGECLKGVNKETNQFEKSENEGCRPSLEEGNEHSYQGIN